MSRPVPCGAGRLRVACGPRQISGRCAACLDGSGRCVCRWAAARPRAVRAASFARRVVSKPGQAPPPPTGTAARPRRPRGGLPSVGVPVCCPARLCRRPPAPQPCLPHRRALVSLTPQLATNFACNSPATISNHEFVALEFQRFLGLLKVCSIELHAIRGEVGADVSECPTKTRRHRGGANLSLSALPIDQTGCICG